RKARLLRNQPHRKPISESRNHGKTESTFEILWTEEMTELRCKEDDTTATRSELRCGEDDGMSRRTELAVMADAAEIQILVDYWYLTPAQLSVLKKWKRFAFWSTRNTHSSYTHDISTCLFWFQPFLYNSNTRFFCRSYSNKSWYSSAHVTSLSFSANSSCNASDISKLCCTEL
ncbi:hypothetical protein HID58_025154, partial [Brassica napus]